MRELVVELKTELGDQEVSPQKFQAPRGTRDFFGPLERARRRVLSVLKKNFELYGFEPLETPAFENWEVLSAKYAGGEEILKESYSFEDQGGRKLGLRYDLTVPFARFFASNPNLPKPFKRYAIGSVWRDGPLKAGRWREFVQCDVDTAGVASMKADAEILALTCAAFAELGVGFKIKLNNRKLLQAMVEKSGVASDKVLSAIISLDKLEKIGWQGVEKELLGKRVCGEKQLVELKKLFTLEEKDFEKELGGLPGYSEIKELLEICRKMGVGRYLVFTPSLARGLNYYTGSIFEAFLENGEKLGVTSSIAAGGRYDDMVGNFLNEASGREEKIPTVGISFGLDVLCEALARLSPDEEGVKFSDSVCRVFVIPIAEEEFSLEVVQGLRKQGVPSAIDLLARGLSKNIEYASKQGIPFVAFVGKQEAQMRKLKLRDLRSGEEKLLGVQEAAAIVYKE